MALRRLASDLETFDLLRTIATSGSLSAAGREHGISQPAVSARVRRLETALGTSLLVRDAQGARLTPSGVLALDWARPALEAASRLEQGLATLAAQRRSRLRVAASTTIAEYLLPGWLVTLRDSDPGISVSLISDNSADTAETIRAGGAELGFVEGPELPAGLSGRTVARDELALVVSPTHPWARRRAVRPELLARTGLISRESGSGTRTFLAHALREHGIPEPSLELSSTTAIKNAVASGLGASVVSSLAVRAEVADGSLVRVPIRGVGLRRSLRAVWLGSPPAGGAAGALLAIASRGSG
ncbi:LysR family transcriptional regulator [Pseudonocardia spinosispora]|uniref:LysR family transcriptional regulator n=1 Tax=Pseudonocardia spinosispora TaxID=103441 RepID=UPI0003F6B880|nr:LysR family transcriptional regulator [Pseudonocardia spinosispora]